MVIGAVVGAVAGLFLAPKSGKELREDTVDLYNKLKDKDPDEVVKEIFGKVTDESREIYEHAHKHLAEQLSDLKDNYKNIDKSKYAEVVSDVVNHVKEEHDLPEAELKTLGKHLNEDFKKLFPMIPSVSTKKAPAKSSAKKKLVAKK